MTDSTISAENREEVAVTRVGVIGLGVMGAPMARHIAAAGFPTIVWARRPEVAGAIPGVTVAASPAELAARSDVVLLVVPGMPEIDSVLGGEAGLLAGASGRLLVICSTVSPLDVQALARRPELRDRAWRVVDAPISGGEQGAEAATLAVFVGGSEEDADLASPVLAATGTPVHLGPLGSGQVGKACNQIIVGATVTALGEAAVLAERSGLDVAALFDLLGGGYAGSRLLDVKKDRFVAHDHSPSGAAKFMIKDLSGALAQAGQVATVLPLTTELLRTFRALTEAGFGDNDTVVVQAWIEQQA